MNFAIFLLPRQSVCVAVWYIRSHQHQHLYCFQHCRRMVIVKLAFAQQLLPVPSCCSAPIHSVAPNGAETLWNGSVLQCQKIISFFLTLSVTLCVRPQYTVHFRSSALQNFLSQAILFCSTSPLPLISFFFCENSKLNGNSSVQYLYPVFWHRQCSLEGRQENRTVLAMRCTTSSTSKSNNGYPRMTFTLASPSSSSSSSSSLCCLL